MKKSTDVDRIFEHFRKGTEMPEALRARYNRLLRARDLLYGIEQMSMGDMIREIANSYQISESMARLDVLEAKRLFPFLDPIERDFEKSWLLQSIKRNIQKAHDKGDLKTVAAEHRNVEKIFGFSRDMGDQGGSNLIINVLNYNPAQLGAVPLAPKELDAKVASMLEQDKQRDEEFEDIDWEDLSDD